MITLDNLDHLLSLIGCVGQHEKRGADWYRCFIHKPQSNGIPLSLGRVMFRNGEYSHTKFYSPPRNGDIMEKDRIYFNWWVVARLDRVLTDDEWDFLVHEATQRAHSKRKAKLEARAKLPKIRPNGKPYSRRAIAPANPRGMAYTVLSEILNEADPS